MSPVNFTGFNAAGRTIYISGHAYDYGYVDTLRGVRPVINLKPNSLKSGDGTASNPYCVEWLTYGFDWCVQLKGKMRKY